MLRLIFRRLSLSGLTFALVAALLWSATEVLPRHVASAILAPAPMPLSLADFSGGHVGVRLVATLPAAPQGRASCTGPCRKHGWVLGSNGTSRRSRSDAERARADGTLARVAVAPGGVLPCVTGGPATNPERAGRHRGRVGRRRGGRGGAGQQTPARASPY